jgi:hypothetical protein
LDSCGGKVLKTKEEAFKYIRKQERKNISYCKVGNSSNKLVVCFASNDHNGFERKTSLVNLKYQENDFDILFIRNRRRWYIGELNGIGKSIADTISFFESEFSKYDKVITTGISAGGYASILFGSICNANYVVTDIAQIDIDYVVKHLGDYYTLLKEFSQQNNETWQMYKDCSKLINEKVDYYVYYKGDENCTVDNRDLINHGDYHFNLIKDFNNVNKIKEWGDIFPKIVECIG